MASHHALVIGASGVIGWSVVNQLLQPAPSPSPFSRITALVNRPLNLEDALWPLPGPGRPQLDLVSGIDLLCSDSEFESSLTQKVPDANSISHVYYFAFKSDGNEEKEVKMNVGMMRRAVRAVMHISSSLQFFIYPGGTRGYGIYRPQGIFKAPLREELADQLPEDYKKTVSYPHYRALLTAESKGERWTWCELCPDAIIGFTPNGSGYSLAGHWAVYLYAYKLVHGDGAEIPFPGTLAGYDSKYTETSASTLARVAIHASLRPGEFRETIFNVADSTVPSTMRERWPQITSWFGLKGVSPLGSASASASDLKPSDFIKEHQERLRQSGVKSINIWNPGQLDNYGYWLTFDRHLNLERLRGVGFKDERKPEDGWWEAFEMFKKAKMIQ